MPATPDLRAELLLRSGSDDACGQVDLLWTNVVRVRRDADLSAAHGLARADPAST